MKYTHWLLFFTVFILFNTSCNRDEREMDVPFEPMFQSADMITVSFTGKVVDENSVPRSGVIVELRSGSEVVTDRTDLFGVFSFVDVNNSGNQVFISAKLNQYFEAFRVFPVLENGIGYTEIKLKEKKSLGYFNVQNDITVSNDSGAKVHLPANGVVDSNGELITSTISLNMNWIDPSSEDIRKEMIGNLVGIDSEGDIKALTTYGMLQVELFDESGSEANLAPGAIATLEFPVPLSMQSTAPNIIELWTFDETVGSWIEEGTAQYVNGVYIGEVSHFSSWNVDSKTDPIDIVGKVYHEIDGVKIPASHYQVFTNSENLGEVGGWLSTEGDFLFYNYPKNEPFELKIFNCDELIYSNVYGPFKTNTNIEEIVVNSPLINPIRVHGSVTDCMDVPLTSAEIKIFTNDSYQLHYTDELGMFDFSYSSCDDKVAPILIRNEEKNLKQSFEVDGSQESWMINPELCDSTDTTGFIEFTIDSTRSFRLDGNMFVGSYGSLRAVGAISEARDIQIALAFLPQASYPDPVMGIFLLKPDQIPGFGSEPQAGNTQLEINITTYNPAGLIIGSFWGTYDDIAIDYYGPPEHSISGTFEVFF